ncbi:MAG: hypothetical protein E3K32_07130 [wastewater metagenome]|nr:hypothetical protein [Candidatus Loosdrechtia aerotolerans]
MRSFLLLKTLTLFSLIVLSPYASATTTAVWTQSEESEFHRGSAHNISVHNTGEIRLSPRVETIAGIQGAFVWSLAIDEQNQIYIGTGDPGIVYRIKDGSEAVEFFRPPEIYVQSLITDQQGNLYVGTSPRGIIYKVNSRGEATVFCRLPAHYIWDMAIDGNSNLYAATGNEGILFKISPDGTADVFFDTPETNLLDILIDQDNNIYIGTEPNGLVYKVSSTGQAQVLYDAHESEIHCLTMDSLGNIYVGTAAGAQVRVPAATTMQLFSEARTVTPLLQEGLAWDLNIPEELSIAQSTNVSHQKYKSKYIGTPQKVANVPSIPNFVYKITQDGFVKKIFEIDKAFIIGMSLDEYRNLYVVTANNSGVHKVYNDETSNSLVDMMDEIQALCCLHTSNNEVYVGTGNDGKVYKISPSFVDKGSFISNVLDTDALSNWGCIFWTGEQPDGTKITLATRSGNCEKPGITWDNWSEPYTVSGAKITSRPARFIQYKAVLQTENAVTTPLLNTVSISYLPKNQPPDIISFVIDKDSSLEKSSRKDSKAESSFRTSPGQKMHYEIAQKAIHWEVKDPNNDTLQLVLYYKGTDEKAWKMLDKNTEKKGFYIWDTLRLPDGEYHIRLVVSDEPDNPPETALRTEDITQPVMVDNSRPVIESIQVVNKPDDRYVISGTAKDSYSNIARVQYTIDGQEWISAFPLDGIFDSTEEPFQITTKALPHDNYTLIINVFDSEGNIGAEKVTIEKE